ncbi:MAG: VTT domain-containing protein [Rickettsiales bacterium]|jgi:membrane protein YqaA with SNARE-associated domain|nr:VTT domain-containing protein [Rickettsiales bacterium]
MLSLIRRLYDYVIKLSKTRYAMWALAFVSFWETTVFPLPTEVIMIPMILARPSRALFISTFALAVNILGGAAGYAIGAFLFDSVGARIIEFFHYTDAFARFAELYHEWGWEIVLAGAFTPLPYKVITIASGFVKMDFAAFVLASLVGRALRYYLIAWLLWKYGDRAREYIERHLGKITVIVFIFIVAGFVAMKYI